MTSQQTTQSLQPAAGAHTKAEIMSQPESWQGAINAVAARHSDIKTFFARHGGRPAVFVGCGSPYYLDLTAAAAYRALTGNMAVALPASEVLLNLRTAIPSNVEPLVIAVSRSGETSELLAACKHLKEQRGSPVLAISVSTDTSLQHLADLTVCIPAASEQSVAQTRSFSAMLLATLSVVAIAADDQMVLDELSSTPARAKAYLERIEGPVADVIALGFDRVFFLGSGMRYGLANEGSLKMKEMSLSNAEPFHFMEFRHGPQSMVDEHTLIVGLLSRHAQVAESKVLREMAAFGGSIVAIQPAPGALHDTGVVNIETTSDLSEIADLVFYMPVLHLLAYYQAMRKGLDCDSPRNLHAWIQLTDL